MPEVVLASFNVHAGVNGWGRPFDVVALCQELATDVLVLEEAWSPDEGPSLARQVADATGLETVFELEMVRARLLDPPSADDGKWGPVVGANRAHGVGLMRDGIRDGTRQIARLGSVHPTRRGTLGVAVLTRLPVVRHSIVDLGRLPKDTARRGAIFVELEVAGSPFTVVGTHLAHLIHGSPRQLAQLRGILPDRDLPAALLGDMNLWGPPLSAALPGWKRAVRGRSWPAWRPIAQPDHILTTASAPALEGEVLRVLGSDHRPVRARIMF